MQLPVSKRYPSGFAVSVQFGREVRWFHRPTRRAAETVAREQGRAGLVTVWRCGEGGKAPSGAAVPEGVRKAA